MKISNFEFSKIIKSDFKTPVGSELYWAPEIHLGIDYNGAHADLFASGVVLFIMVTGNPPF